MSGDRSERGAMGPGAVAAGTILCLALAFFVAVFLPVTNSAGGADAAGSPRSYDDLSFQGRKLYIREGCFSCHTQGIRDSFSDSLLGPRPSQPGDYANDAPNLIGTIRLGPDLTCVGDREDDPAWFAAHLADPRSVREHSTMPSYDYLSDGELRALAAYLLRLTCEEG